MGRPAGGRKVWEKAGEVGGQSGYRGQAWSTPHSEWVVGGQGLLESCPPWGPLVHGCLARGKGALTPDAQGCHMAWHSWGHNWQGRGARGSGEK